MLLPLLQNNVQGSGIAPVFTGPNIADFSLAQNIAMVARDYAPRFTEYESQAMTFAVIGTLPTGLSLSAAGVLTGTPTTLGTSGALQIEATDTDTDTVTSNEFTITISVGAGSADIGGGNVGGPDVGYGDLGTGDLSTPPGWLG